MRDVIRVIDSSLHATVPFPVFLTKNSYPLQNDRGMEVIIMRRGR